MSERSILVAGEALIDFIPDAAGPLSDVETFHRRAGGAPTNVAVGLARLDETPWLCTTLSTDPFGEFLADRLADEGIPEAFLTRVDNPTALAFVSHAADGDREFSFHRERTADTVLQTDVVETAALSAADWLVVGGVALSAEPTRTAVFELVDRAREAGCRIVFDPNTRPELWDDDLSLSLERMLLRTDVLKATREDFAPTALLDADAEFTDQLLDMGPDTVLETAGSEGARLVAGPDSPWGAGEWHHAGYALDAIDTTGAGDAFLAGALAALAEGETPADPEAVLAFANAVAAVSTTAAGAMAALPDRSTVEELYEGP